MRNMYCFGFCQARCRLSVGRRRQRKAVHTPTQRLRTRSAYLQSFPVEGHDAGAHGETCNGSTRKKDGLSAVATALSRCWKPSRWLSGQATLRCLAYSDRCIVGRVCLGFGKTTSGMLSEVMMRCPRHLCQKR
ncbi:hypothetical protein VTK73DRAFT_3815 [Phialemonium thermophilum]|uniref:Uncharacterized protein n=1 Tax=Phialemonium thermophilum TaxID=223376 RepID=A0ABR3VEU3_9PEZI